MSTLANNDRVGHRERILTTLVPAIGFLLVPAILWASPFGTTTNVGGDAPNLLFLHPLQFLLHVGFKANDNGLAGYDQFITDDSAALAAVALKALHLNPEIIFSGAVLALTYLGVQRLVLQVLPTPQPKAAWRAACFAGAVASTAPLVAQLFWATYLPRLVLLPLVPWLVVLTARFVESGRLRNLLAAGVACALCASGVVDVPGSLPAFIFYVAAVAITTRRTLLTRRAVARLAGFVGGVAALNAYWLVPFGLYVGRGGEAAYATSGAGVSQTIQQARLLAGYQSLPEALSLQVSHPMMNAFHWSQLVGLGWLRSTEAFGYLPAASVVLGVAVSLRPQAASRYRTVFVPLALLAVVMLGFATLRLPGSIAVFDGLAHVVPAWTSVRTFFGTFAIPYVLAMSIAAAVGLVVLAEARPRAALVISSVGAAVFVLYGGQLLTGLYFKLPYSSASPARRVLDSLPTGYEATLRRVATNSAPVLSLPLTTTTWSYLAGRDTSGANVTYIGLSPLFNLRGVIDYDGLTTFDTAADPTVVDSVTKAAVSGTTSLLARTIAALGVHWIIDEKIASSDTAFAGSVGAANAEQGLAEAAAIERLLHSRRTSTAGRYSLRKVGSEAAVPYVAIDRVTPFLSRPGGLGRVASGAYAGPLRSACPGLTGGSAYVDSRTLIVTVTRPLAAGRCAVVYRAAYSSSWQATVRESGRVSHVRSSQAYGFANGFVLPALAPGRVVVHLDSDSASLWPFGGAVSAIALVALAGAALRRTRTRAED